MERLNFLRRLRRIAPSLPDLKVIGGPVDIIDCIEIPFMPSSQTTLRTIELRKSEDGQVYVIVWRVDKSIHNKIFNKEVEAQAFYHVKMKELREECDREAAEIKARLGREFEESWNGAQKVWHGNGFALKVFYRETHYEEACVINPKMLGFVRFTCPNCKKLRVLDARQSFSSFIQKVEDTIASFGAEPASVE